MLARLITVAETEHASAMLDTIFRWSESDQYPAALRAAIADRVLVPMLRCCALPAAESFFTKRVAHIMSAVSEQQEMKTEHTIRARTAAFSLVHIMFERLPLALLYGPGERAEGKKITGPGKRAKD